MAAVRTSHVLSTVKKWVPAFLKKNSREKTTKTESTEDVPARTTTHAKHASKVKAHKAKAYRNKVKAHAAKGHGKKKTAHKAASHKTHSHKSTHSHKAKSHHQGEKEIPQSAPFSHVNPYAAQDPAHSPGHRRLNVKGEFTDPSGEKTQIQHSALNRMAPADRINRVTAQNRINGFVNAAGTRRRRGSKTAH